MNNQDIACISEVNNAISDSRLIAYGNKSVKLNIMEDVIAMYENSYLEKKELLEREKLKLDELNYQVLSQENSFCEEVWRFSFEHDFSVIFKYYPFVKETNHCAKQKDHCTKDIEGSSELIDLISEIDTLKAEVCNLKNGANIKRDVENALKNLQQLQLISDDITKSIKLLSPPENSHNIPVISMPTSSTSVKKGRQYKKYSNCEDLKNKKIRGNQKELLLRNKSQLQTNSVQLDNELNLLRIDKKKVIVSSKKAEEEVPFHQKMTTLKPTNNGKSKNFTLKKPSEISIKFQKYREQK